MVFLLGENPDRLSIVADILEAATSGSSKTRKTFKAKLSFSLLEKYLNLVMRSGFLERQEGKYRLSAHREDFLTRYRQVDEGYTNSQKLAEALGK